MSQERPAKRLKISDQPAHVPDRNNSIFGDDTSLTEVDNQRETASAEVSGSFRALKNKSRYGNQPNSSSRPEVIRTFSQPSAMCAGDRGVYVTCDKGREKKSLLEFQDIVQQYLDQQNIDTMGRPLVCAGSLTENTNNLMPSNHAQDDEPGGIEANIASELRDMRKSRDSETNPTQTSKAAQLITLDIPCVSFLRLPPGTNIDPVRMVHAICDEAAEASAQKSRYIKRLTPMSNLDKVLNDGLDKVCEQVLPLYFGKGSDVEIQSTTFAIRPTVRNNDKIDRDQIIKTVASKIQKFGQNRHRVDLKNSKKCVLVEVYRGWVGISVIDNVDTGSHQRGYEQLKRFNLAEIYASR